MTSIKRKDEEMAQTVVGMSPLAVIVPENEVDLELCNVIRLRDLSIRKLGSLSKAIKNFQLH